MNRKPKVVLISIFYPMSISRYFENALKRRDDIELITAGPYTGNFIPWKNGMFLLPKYAKPIDFPLPQNSISLGSVSPKIFQSNPAFADVDMWLMVDAGFCLSEHPNTGMVVEVQTDPHVLQEHYKKARSFADFVFCMQTPYLQQNDQYLPYAYDPGVHYPVEPELDKIYDATMIGLHYPNRTAWVDGLRSRGLAVNYDIGPVFDEYRWLYNQTKVGINWSSRDDLVARVWELAAMKVPMVVNDVPDLSLFFKEGREYWSFKNLQQAIENTVTLCKDDAKRKELSENAFQLVTKGKHTYDDRIQKIFEVTELL